MSDDTADAVVIERTFAAPVEVIWGLWTDPDRFKQWYGPDGASVPVAEMDVRVGGSRLVCMEMQTPRGSMKMWFVGQYLEVIENQRLVFTESMADEHGNQISPSDMGMPEGHPGTTEIHVELDKVGDQTKMVLTHIGILEGSPGAAGWAMAFEKLASLASTLS